jgi:UDP-2,3-diacylglucosamine hydrolase
MSTLFISDLHLDESRPAILAEFERFLREQARAASALYILGDLFESWIGDDDDAALAARVAASLSAVRATGVPVFFMHGNRDFLVGARYAERAGMTLLEDPTVVELGGERVLLMHGDTLCTDDAEYQRFRTLVRDPDWQARFLAKPLAERRAFAAQARGESQRQTSMKPSEIMDVNAAAVEAAMRSHGVLRLIHGHTHRPATHRFELDGAAAERVVLGDWYEQGSAFTWPRSDGAR